MGTHGSSGWLFPLPGMLLPHRWTGQIPHLKALTGLREHGGDGAFGGLLGLYFPRSLGE